jgi:hypothetical protein
MPVHNISVHFKSASYTCDITVLLFTLSENNKKTAQWLRIMLWPDPYYRTPLYSYKVKLSLPTPRR